MLELLIIALPISAVLFIIGLVAWVDWPFETEQMARKQRKRHASRVFMVDVKRRHP